ncbi:MAG: LacI family DNA-binding transcriptional regulator [Bilifractor sp.]
MSATAKEIAKKLNLSETAISLALRGKPGVSTATRNLVLKTAQEMGYDFVRTTSQGQIKGTICLVIYKAHNAILSYTPIFNEIEDGIRTATHDRGIPLKIFQFYEHMDHLKNLFEELRMADCAGIILLGTELEENVAALFAEQSVPVVVLDSYFHNLRCDSVGINNRTGAYIATSHLIRSREGNPGHLTSSYRIENFIERREGFLDAVRENGLSIDACPTISLAPSFEGAMTDMLSYIDSGKPLARSFFADNDILAIGAMKAMKVRGIKIPEDVAVIGFDNISEGRITEPALTTMDVPRKILAEHAVSRLLHRIKMPADYPITLQITPRLVKRFSL